jgi:hypothetical protein
MVSTYFTKGMGLLIDLDFEAALQQCNGQDNAADTTADDGNAWLRGWHCG